MAYIAVSRTPITVRETSGPVDPGYGQGGERPDQGLPPVQGPVDPSYDWPLPPVTITPLPPMPGHPLPVPPSYPVKPSNDLPQRPHVWPRPPRPVDPDPDYDRPIPVYPSLPIYMPAPGAPDNSLPLPPASIWPPLPDEVDGVVMVLVWVPGVGYRWIVVDTNLKPTHPIAPPPLYPDNSLPETPEPKG